ncbi:Histone-lysine N-methyltransferase [Bertholletia excelsa]
MFLVSFFDLFSSELWLFVTAGLLYGIFFNWQKEYARYKQSKGWKHLVVYKSGIHALGLYTAQFISRGAMVVEYVGEIVGLRVADKRENEYQSGRKLQYKSACYFFRIDKEHIIDATRKGGIARFVNHSCLPNCVAKVISVRNEKKVVFFAERDIYPGEEITYDYHFNHEDEGKKIPCSCNSKNCRRYLN